MYCKKCDWYFNDETCPKCGDEGTGEIEPNICPICNTPNDESEKFCKKCKCFLEPGESNYDDCYAQIEEEYVEPPKSIKDFTCILCYIAAGIEIVCGIIIFAMAPSLSALALITKFLFWGVVFLALGRVVNYLKIICDKLNTINFIEPNNNGKEKIK